MYLTVTDENDYSFYGNSDSEDAEEQEVKQEHFMYNSKSTTESKYKQKKIIRRSSLAFPLLSDQHADFLITTTAQIPKETNV